MAAEEVQVLQGRIKLYEDEIREIRRLTGEIDETRIALTQAEAKLSELSSEVVDIGKEKSLINRQISIFKKYRIERARYAIR